MIRVTRTLTRVLFVATSLVTASCADLIGVESLSGVDGGIDAAPDAALADTNAACDIAWIDAVSGAVPSGAVPSSISDAGPTLFVCRASSESDTIPGKLLPAWGCYYSDGQTEHLASTYQVLVPSRCTIGWAGAPGGIAPPNAIACGRDARGALYACRVGPSADHPRELGHMGWGTNHTCVYSYGGASLGTSDFEVLTAQ